MSKLTTKEREVLPSSEFALPGRRYPINDANHARNALSRAAANASPAQQATIRRKVSAHFPGIAVGGHKELHRKMAHVERKHTPK